MLSFTLKAALLVCLMTTVIEAMPSHNLLDRPKGLNGFYVCLPQHGFCCAATVSGFLFPSYANSVCQSMSVCYGNGTVISPDPGLWQNKDCTTRITSPSQVPDCTGHIQTTNVNVTVNYITALDASQLRPQLLLVFTVLSAVLAGCMLGA